MNQYLLGIDIGTSGCKSILMNLDGSIAAASAESYPTSRPQPGWEEQDPQDWWQCVLWAVRKLRSTAGINFKNVLAVGVTGHSWAALAVDAKGRALAPAMIWRDMRARKECQWLLQRLGQEAIFELAGNPVAPGYTLPKLLWLKEHRPHIFEEAHLFLQTNAYLVHRLTGKFSHDLSQGYGLHCFDIAAGRWDEAFCQKIDFPVEKLAPLYGCHEVVGGLLPAAAKELGLPPGCPVVAGGLDAAAGALGAGVFQAGQVQEQGGQAGGMSICVGRPLSHEALILGFHVLPDLWLLQGGTVGGSSLAWWQGILGTDQSFQAMSLEAAQSPPGSRGVLFLPYMAGERSPIWDGQARGVLMGLAYSKNRADLTRALMEGNAFALRHNLETAESTGLSVAELKAVGGAAQSAVWMQIKADVTGKEIAVAANVEHATAKGAAILAGIGAGLYSPKESSLKGLFQEQARYSPDFQHKMIYDQQYEIYLRLYERLQDEFPKLNQFE